MWNIYESSSLLFEVRAYIKVIQRSTINMAVSQAANVVEKVIGHDDNATVTTDVSNYKNEYGMESGPLIKATTWQGKKKVSVGKSTRPEKIMLDRC